VLKLASAHCVEKIAPAGWVSRETNRSSDTDFGVGDGSVRTYSRRFDPAWAYGRFRRSLAVAPAVANDRFPLRNQTAQTSRALIADTLCSAGFWMRRLATHLGGRLVLAPASIDDLAQQIVAGPGKKFHFGHQLWPYPMHPAQHEWRAEAAAARRRHRLLTRTGLDWTYKYPAIATAVASLGARQAYLDGELAVAVIFDFGQPVPASGAASTSWVSCGLIHWGSAAPGAFLSSSLRGIGYWSTIGSISDGSLFFTLPTRGLTGQQIMSSEG